MFDNKPDRTDLTCHTTAMGQARAIKQESYRLNPHKLKLVRKKFKHMLNHKISQPSQSE